MRNLLVRLAAVGLLIAVVAHAEPTYVGSDACNTCHSSYVDDVWMSGHPHKLTAVDGVAPTMPYPAGDTVTVPNPWAGATWDSVTYMIGGFGWKARFLDADGWIVTGDEVQYNLATQGWVGYHSDEDRGTKPYDCGTCHTTGWQPDTSLNHDDLSLHQDGLAGIWGTWSETGVRCEACHGPGSDHIVSASAADIELADTETCGVCHSRGDVNVVDVSGGLIKHHEQYEEILLNVAPHNDCQTCHDPHTSTINDLGGIMEIGSSCGSGEVGCHSEVTLNPVLAAHGEMPCYSCHMPYTTKSATSTGEGVHLKGDLRGHRVRIAISEQVAADTMFNEAGTALAGDFVTLDFACLQCHNGVDAPQRDMAWAAASAPLVHAAAPQDGYVGASTCRACHSGIYDEVFQSGHPYKLNEVVAGTPPSYPFVGGRLLSVVPGTPAPTTWDSVSYVIGGYHWKARFLDLEGWIITGDEVQYNFATDAWSGYHADEARGTKPYNCGACHTTGWVPDESPNHDNLSMHQDGLPGIWGTWSETGITCEGCHGPGAEHASGPSRANIGHPTTETCGTCHSRGDVNVVDVSGGLIKHHEQYEEILLNSAPHDDCQTCHNPHRSVVNDLGGVTDIGASCGAAEGGCHGDVTVNTHVAGHDALECFDCHMPFTAKSATSTGAGVYLKGDLRGHRVRIAVTDLAAADTMFNAEGTALAGDFVTLDFACLQCHNGVDASQQDLGWAAANAESMHEFVGPQITAVRDIPEDQGGRVAIAWNAAPMDGDVNVLPNYSVWRALPEGAAKPASGRYRVARSGGVEYTWGWLADVPALRLSSYYYVARTLFDSSATTDGVHTFMVVAHSADPNEFGMSDVASGYSVDNLAPIAPNLRPAAYEAGKVALNWAPNRESDLATYLVYRGDQPNFAIPGMDPLATTRDTMFVDDNPLTVAAYYVVVAQDIHDNVSLFSNQVDVIPVGIGSAIPEEFALFQNAPNPFNPTTTIRFALPEATQVRLVIYTQSGQVVRTLLDGEVSAGYRDVVWNATDDNGAHVASGVYIYRLESSLGTQVRRMLLVR